MGMAKDWPFGYSATSDFSSLNVLPLFILKIFIELQLHTSHWGNSNEEKHSSLPSWSLHSGRRTRQ